MHPERVRRLEPGDCAIHHVLERVRVGDPAARTSTVAWVIATNVFLKTARSVGGLCCTTPAPAARAMQELMADGDTLH